MQADLGEDDKQSLTTKRQTPSQAQSDTQVISTALWLLPAAIALLLLAFWAAGVVWGSGYSLVNNHDALAAGYSHPDPLFLSAYAAMLNTYGIPSTGIDGLPYVPYHFSSLWFAGQLAQSIHVSTYTVYNHIFPILSPAFFIATFLWLVAGLHPQKDWNKSILFWGVLTAGITRILPYEISRKLDMTNYSLLSESNAFAFALFFLTAGFIVRGAYKRRWFLWVTLPILCLIIGLTKESTLYLAIVALATLTLYYRLYRQPRYILSALLITPACAISYLATRNTFASTPIAPFEYLTNLTDASPLVWLICNFGWSWLYIGLRLHERKRPYADVLVVATLCFAGMIPTLLIHIPGGSGAYFIDLQRFISLALILAWLPAQPHFRLWQKVALIGIAVVVVGNVIVSALYFVTWTTNIPQTQSAVLDQLDQLATIDDKAHTALYIPRDHPYWSLLSATSNSCPPSGFIAPALTGIALIDGIPNQNCFSVEGYGYSSYSPHSPDPCSRAIQFGITKIIVLETTTTTSMLNCVPTN